eukprot:NODE_696_length_2824_cov_3.601038.p1 GENE.NODE_696_length_2824_cov_3.601038~~NODE_696_length_2824_cov_3.601038.p1  ORF type:complete len:922 (-),score=213.04 NODE_696_length_2824_cov_3.601038:59-2737(-)
MSLASGSSSSSSSNSSSRAALARLGTSAGGDLCGSANGLGADDQLLRQGQLPKLLQDSLGGNARLVVLATISPAYSCSKETLATLGFAAAAQRVMSFPRVNVIMPEQEVRKLQAEVQALRKVIDTSLPTAAIDAAILKEDEEAMPQHLEQLQLSHVEQLRSAERLQKLCTATLQGLGIMTQVPLSEQQPACFLNISNDPMLAGCLVYPLAANTCTTVGAAPDNVVVLRGLGMANRLCTIWFGSQSGLLQITNLDPARNRVLVNGSLVSSTPQALADNDRVVLGRAHAFRVALPGPDWPAIASSVNRPPMDLDECLREADLHSPSEALRAISSQLNEAETRLEQKDFERLTEALRALCPLVDDANEMLQDLRPSESLSFEVVASTATADAAEGLDIADMLAVRLIERRSSPHLVDLWTARKFRALVQVMLSDYDEVYSSLSRSSTPVPSLACLVHGNGVVHKKPEWLRLGGRAGLESLRSSPCEDVAEDIDEPAKARDEERTETSKPSPWRRNSLGQSAKQSAASARCTPGRLPAQTPCSPAAPRATAVGPTSARTSLSRGQQAIGGGDVATSGRGRGRGNRTPAPAAAKPPPSLSVPAASAAAAAATGPIASSAARVSKPRTSTPDVKSPQQKPTGARPGGGQTLVVTPRCSTLSRRQSPPAGLESPLRPSQWSPLKQTQRVSSRLIPSPAPARQVSGALVTPGRPAARSTTQSPPASPPGSPPRSPPKLSRQLVHASKTPQKRSATQSPHGRLGEAAPRGRQGSVKGACLDGDRSARAGRERHSTCDSLTSQGTVRQYDTSAEKNREGVTAEPCNEQVIARLEAENLRLLRILRVVEEQLKHQNGTELEGARGRADVSDGGGIRSFAFGGELPDSLMERTNGSVDASLPTP